MQFYTLNKKPKLWHLIPLSLAFLLLILVFLAGADWDIYRGGPAVQQAAMASCCYLALVILFLLRALYRQLRYNPYSYNIIYYSGFALYLLVALGTELFLTTELIRAGEAGLVNVFDTITSSGSIYMLISYPFLVIFSLGLIVSNLILLKKEGFSFPNILGILLALFLMGAPAYLWFRFDYISGSETEVMLISLAANVLSALFLYFETMLMGTIYANVIAVKHRPAPDKEYVIVLGCQVGKDGKPRPLLRGRLDRALAFARWQEEQGGPQVKFVCSGGKGGDEPCSEAEAMGSYLERQGIPRERILLEDQSVNTLENFRFSKEKLLQDGGDLRKTVFSTTNYHVFRSGIWSNRVKLKSEGIAADTKWYFWPNASVREFAGLLTAHRGKQALILMGMLLIYGVLPLITFFL